MDVVHFWWGKILTYDLVLAGFDLVHIYLNTTKHIKVEAAKLDPELENNKEAPEVPVEANPTKVW